MTEEEERQDAEFKRLILLFANSTGSEREQAFALLHEQAKKVVWAFAANYFDKTDENLLDPICEQALFTVARRAASYVPKGKFTTWLYDITDKLCAMAARTEGRRRRRFRGVEEASE